MVRVDIPPLKVCSCSSLKTNSMHPSSSNVKDKQTFLSTSDGRTVSTNLLYMYTSPEALDHYFDILEETLDQNDLSSKPCQIYNCDETGMPLDPAPPKVIAQKGQKHTQSITTSNKKLKLLCCLVVVQVAMSCHL